MSLGLKLGRAIGAGAALVVEGSVRGANGLGRFGADVVAGTEEGYEKRHAQLLVSRAAKTAARDAALAAARQQHGAAMAMVPTAGPLALQTTP